MTPARPVNLYDLPPAKRRELQDAIDRHPATAAPTARMAAPAAPPQPDPPVRSGRKRDRWRCHQCDQQFGTAEDLSADLERHRDQLGHVRYDWVEL